MAKILTTAIVADIRNKLNGSVFSKNRYGAYVRTKVTPVNPQTAAQQNQRSILAANSQAWRSLTESQRQAWITAASDFPFTDIYGNAKILSGQALYVKLNNTLQKYNLSTISDPPSPVAIPLPGIVSVDADASATTVIVTLTASPIPANFGLVIFATPNVTPGKNFVKNLFRFVQIYSGAVGTSLDISADYTPLFGNPVIGQKIFVRGFLFSTISGQVSIPQQTATIVVA